MYFLIQKEQDCYLLILKMMHHKILVIIPINRSENKNKDIRSNINNYKEEKKIINETKKYETTHKYGKNINSSSNYITWNAKTENKYKININANKEDKKSMNSIYNNKDKDKDKKNSDDPLIKNSIRYKYKRKNMD